VKKREQLEKLRDLDHYLTQNGRFRGILFQIKHMPPGRKRDRTIENFWISVYNGYHVGDLDSLQYRGHALSEYLSTLDEMNEVSPIPPERDTSMMGADFRREWKGRSSAVSEMGVLALE
jgi:hypothetical protein